MNDCDNFHVPDKSEFSMTVSHQGPTGGMTDPWVGENVKIKYNTNEWFVCSKIGGGNIDIVNSGENLSCIPEGGP